MAHPRLTDPRAAATTAHNLLDVDVELPLGCELLVPPLNPLTKKR